jgi:AcrR family transcriptional regulator
VNVQPAPRQDRQVARAEGLERTREALLDAAEAAFFAGRWDSASLAELAGAAGVTKQTLLRHFGSKGALRQAAMGRAMVRVRDQRWSAPTDDVAGAVANLLDHYEAVGERALMIGRLDRGDMTGEDAHTVSSSREMHYEWVDHVFGARLSALPAVARGRRRAALITLCDVQTWWILSHDLGQARAETQATLTDAIERLLEETT